jgi:hypothetical protein
MIYQKFQKNEENPNINKTKGLALFLAHDLEKGWTSEFQTSFMTYYIHKNEENRTVLFSLHKSHRKVTSTAKY